MNLEQGYLKLCFPPADTGAGTTDCESVLLKSRKWVCTCVMSQYARVHSGYREWHAHVGVGGHTWVLAGGCLPHPEENLSLGLPAASVPCC